MSLQQNRIWSLLEEATTYRAQVAFLLEGAVDAAALESAARDTVARHEILRTKFSRPSGLKYPLQVVSDDAGLVWTVVDASSEDDSVALERVMRAEREESIDPAAGPPLRVALLTLGPDRHAVVLTTTPLASDAEGLTALMREIVPETGSSAGADEPFHYVDFAAWQAELREEENAALARRFWEGKNAAALAGLRHPLAGESSGPHAPTRVRLSLDGDVAARVSAASAETGIPAERYYLAAWRVLLTRMTGAREVLVGLRDSGRFDEEIGSAVGPYAVYLPVRSEVDVDHGFEEALAAVSAELAKATDWSPYFGWEDLGLDGPTGPGAMPFAFDHLNVPDWSGDGIAVTLLDRHEVGDRFELRLACVESGIGTRLDVYVDSASLSGADAAGLIGQLETLLDAALRAPSAPVGTLPMIGPEEREQLVVAFQGETEPVPTDRVCAHHLFEAWATRDPHRVALVFEGEALTYGALDHRAGVLAAELARRGVGAGARVGICAPRSAEVVVGMLAALKAGAAYVPLDASMPARRLASLVADAGISVLLGEESTLAALETPGVDRLDLGACSDLPGSPSPHGAGLERGAAYVLFTSGTTGTPKGVVVEHAQLVGYAQAVSRRLDLEPGATYATVSSFSADLGNTAIFGALCTGGCLHVVSDERRTDPGRFAEYQAARRVDCVKIVPSHLEALLSAEGPARVLPLRRLVLGGEATRWELVDRIRGLSPTCAVLNHYGPTETTVGALTLELSERDPHATTLPLGTPLRGYRAYVLDAGGHPLPVGASGEVLLGGVGVARGYLGRPGETAERFVPDPFGPEGARLYRTGDQARHLPSGVLEFRGRLDDQVKIRGYRVELAEVEAALEQLGPVGQAVVVAANSGQGDPRLVAYWVPSGPSKPASAELVEELASFVPDYMIPGQWVSLPSLPLTPNGKVDRAALPEPEAVERTARTAPSTPTEVALAAIWNELLRREELGRESDFFDLGGHSLSAMQLISRIRQAFDVELPLLAIFEDSTLAGLAARIDQGDGVEQGTGAPPIERIDRSGPIPVSFSQERLWMFEQLQPDTAAYNIPVGVTVAGPLGVAALEQSIAEIVRRHEVLRTTFDTHDGAPVQVVDPEPTGPRPVVDLSGLKEPDRETTVERVADRDARRPFDLSAGPLWRAAVLRLAPGSHGLLWNQHHICSDAWSAGVFAQELSTLYGNSTAGLPSDLPELELQYADYAAWQRRWLDASGGEDQLAYWLDRLSDAPPEIGLPTDRPRPHRQTFKGGMASRTLSPELSARISEIGRERGATLYVTLLAAFATLLRLHGAEQEVVIGSPTAGRGRPEIEPMIGFFLNTLALKVPVEIGSTFGALVERTRTDVLSAFANQELPFERVVDALDVERDASRTPVYQVMYNHQKANDPGDPFPGLDIQRIGVSTAPAKFDLTLYSNEGVERTQLGLAYNRSIFDESTAAALLDRLVVLLEAIAEDPDRRIRDLPLLSEEERAADADVRVRPAERDDGATTLIGRFLEQAERDPERPAIRTDAHSWSYGRVAEEARGVAARLAEAGGTGGRVGLLFAADAPLFSAMLGSWLAGSAYVPLDPANPRARLAHMLEDSGAGVVLTDEANSDLARELAGESTTVVNVEEGSHPGAAGAATEPGPEDPAYILYTSGSTGLPKGVVQSHRNALHHAEVYSASLAITPDDRLSLLSSYGFDGAVMDILGALLNGASLHPLDIKGGFVDVLDALSERGVTIYHSTPTVYRQLMAHAAGRPPFSSVRAVVLGGEEALATDLELFRERFGPDAVLVNGLGPSESTVTLQHFMDHRTRHTRTALPVGRPVADTEVVLLDEHGTPTDVHGEIAILGEHVAVEYWGAPDLTAEAFAEIPGREGRRCYRTGDLARRLPDGTLEFLGRKDAQVKIRGVRIEPSEVETALMLSGLAKQAVVIARDGASGEKELVAYVVPASAVPPSSADLRAKLGERLPGYMLPAAFVTVGSIPLTATGKVDVGRLPEPAVEPEFADDDFEAPETPQELVIAQVWQEVLNMDEVSVHDRFFDLGGQSLQAVAVITRLKQEHGYQVAFADLTYQTLRQIAAALQ